MGRELTNRDFDGKFLDAEAGEPAPFATERPLLLVPFADVAEVATGLGARTSALRGGTP